MPGGRLYFFVKKEKKILQKCLTFFSGGYKFAPIKCELIQVVFGSFCFVSFHFAPSNVVFLGEDFSMLISR